MAIWAFLESSAAGWVVMGVTMLMAIATTYLKYRHPGRKLRAAGIPTWLLFVAVGVGVIGFFAVPLIGGPLFFVMAIYTFERKRKGREAAWPSTKTALRAIAESIGIELTGAMLIAVVFGLGALIA